MVTSNKVPEKKIVNMAEQNNTVVIPQRTLLGEVNVYITCPLCRGYYIDATTIVECLHSFCRSCIIKHLQVNSYCPVCEMMINSAKPNIKLDKALQDIVYKLVPGLFQKEMERRQKFYASRPGPAASATPEQRGEDTERIIFSPEDVISFSLEYADATDTDSISSKSSDSNDQPSSANRRFLQCPAVVNISHLKKFLSMKFDVDSTQFAIDILYKRVPLPDYYTLMDIAYIYNWKRNEPMRFFYQIIDYVAIRNRLFDNNRKGSHFHDRKPSPALTEDTNTSSPAPNVNDQGSEASSGTDSPMPDESGLKKNSDNVKNSDNPGQQSVDVKKVGDTNSSVNIEAPKKNDDEVEKSQFLNSFELTAKSAAQEKCSPSKLKSVENSVASLDSAVNSQSSSTGDQVTLPTPAVPSPKSEPKTDDLLKRKSHNVPNMPEIKKLRIELEKAKLPANLNTTMKPLDKPTESVGQKSSGKATTTAQDSTTPTSPIATKELKPPLTPVKQSIPETSSSKKLITGSTNTLSPKRKTAADSSFQAPNSQKTVSPLKLQIPKLETPKPNEPNKAAPKKIPDLKPTTPTQPKGPPVNRVRMDLLANNCDPTIDRSKILSQVKTSLAPQNSSQTSGDPLKSLFDSCKINIPSSLSITLTDQKLDERPGEGTNESKKVMVNKNFNNAGLPGAGHNSAGAPVHNYIEILKLPDAEPKKSQTKAEVNEDKSAPSSKVDPSVSNISKPSLKPETTAKGPVPNLKPISDTKMGKTGNYSGPITFQQTFEKQLQSLQSDKKSKLPKAKSQVPKLVPAPKTYAANKLNNPNPKTAAPIGSGIPATETKSGAALDLSTPHNIQSQLGPQQSKAFETMQSIANLAKKQNLTQKPLPPGIPQTYTNVSNRPIGGAGSMRVPAPTNINQIKLDKINQSGIQTNTLRNEISSKTNQQMKPGNSSSPTVSSPGYQMQSQNSPNTTQPSPRSTRSPSSSPKLVIAEEKQLSGPLSEPNANQSNQISSTQLPNPNLHKNESPKATPSSSKANLKQIRPTTPGGKPPAVRQPITPNQIKPQSPVLSAPTDYLPQPLLSAHHAHHLLRQQMEMQNAWFKAQRQYDLFKSMSNMAHQNQTDFNNKDKM